MPKRCILVGNSHIDVAWLWPKEETKQVVKETFRSVVRLIRRFGITFAQSNAIFYDWLKEVDPELLSEIRRLVDSDYWELVGGSLVEFDANMPLGESLVRQFLLGQRIFVELFGRKARICWLPDTFGFPVSLPKIIRHVGMEFFLTTKITWNDTTRFPYNMFLWVGDDGSTVVAHLYPTVYTLKLKEDSCDYISGLWWDSNKPEEIMVLYGEGDHGGGPKESDAVIGNKLVKLGKAKFGKAIEFFEKIKNMEMNSWNDELYLEFHRGVYTAQSTLKKLIRSCEAILLDLDVLFVFSYLLGRGIDYIEKLEELWKITLVNQFHDIMAGSLSIDATKESLEELLRCYIEAKKLLNSLVERLLHDLRGRYVINTLPWSREIVVNVGDEELVCEVPPYSISNIEKLKCKKYEVRVIETQNAIAVDNGKLRVLVSKKTGSIVSLRDKESNTELLKGPIRIRIYEDKPSLKRKSITGIPAILFDAWEVYAFDEKPKYVDVPLPKVRLEKLSKSLVIISAEGKISFSPWDKARIKVMYYIWANKPYIETKVKINSKLKHRLVKLIIPFATETQEAIFGAPYGKVKRFAYDSESADLYQRAKYEAPSTGWVAIRKDKGLLFVTTINRFGFTWSKDFLGVSILRAPMFPTRQLIEKPSRLRLVLSLSFYRSRIPLKDKILSAYLSISKLFSKYMDQGSKETTLRIGFINTTSYSEVVKIWQDLLRKPVIVLTEGKNIVERIQPMPIQTNIFVHSKIAEDKSGVILRIWNPNDSDESISIRVRGNIKHVNGLEEAIDEEGSIESNRDEYTIHMRRGEICSLKISQ